MYKIPNDKKNIPPVLTKNDILDNIKNKCYNVIYGNIINLEWLKNESGNKEYVIAETMYSSGESVMYAVIPNYAYNTEKQTKFNTPQ